jgi:hypothetical protein
MKRAAKEFHIGYWVGLFVACISGSEILKTSTGKPLDCWIVEHKPKPEASGHQKFWISKSTTEVVKQEEYMDGMYKYRIKLVVHP